MTTLRNAWITPKPTQARHTYVMTPQGRGWIWDGTPLNVQIKRDKIAVCFGDDKAAQYFQRHEIEIQEQ
jgi:hypothetical protein